jgi:polyferredoxin
MKLYRFRVLVQLLVLLIIAIITADIIIPAESVLPWLSRFSPVMTITNRLSAMQWSPYYAGGVLVAFLSMIFPRLFCGWICPLGTCIDITDRLTLAGKRKYAVPSSWKIAFTVFMGLVIASVFHYDIAGFFDPLTIVGNTAMAINSMVTDSTESAFTADYHYYSKMIGGIFLGTLALTIFGR